MQIQNKIRFFLEDQLPKRNRLRIKGGILIVPRVIMRDAVLALIPILHTILIDKGNGIKRGTLPECATEIRIRQHRAQKSFHRMGRHHLARVMTGGQKDGVLRRAFPDRHKLHVPSLAAPAEGSGPQEGISFELPEKRFKIALEILHSHTENHFLSCFGTGVFKRAIIGPALPAEPAPGTAVVQTERRPASSDLIVACKMEAVNSLLRKHRLETPVEPVA